MIAAFGGVAVAVDAFPVFTSFAVFMAYVIVDSLAVFLVVDVVTGVVGFAIFRGYVTACVLVAFAGGVVAVVVAVAVAAFAFAFALLIAAALRCCHCCFTWVF